MFLLNLTFRHESPKGSSDNEKFDLIFLRSGGFFWPKKSIVSGSIGTDGNVFVEGFWRILIPGS